jgi:hypothetical protein
MAVRNTGPSGPQPDQGVTFETALDSGEASYSRCLSGHWLHQSLGSANLLAFACLMQ